MSESVIQPSSGAEMPRDTAVLDAGIGSGDPGAAVVNGEVSVALVRNANNPIAEKQTAERVRLDDDDGRKCCTLL